MTSGSESSLVPPEAPPGINDLHSQPGMETDASLRSLQEALEAGLSEDVLDRLTRFVQEDVPEGPTEAYRETALSYVQECISYREAIRPDSLRPIEDLPDGIGRVTSGAWVWYFGDNDEGKHDVSKDEAGTTEHGKYLFFTPDVARLLENIVLKEFQARPFTSAKMPTTPAKREDWVLCLYDDDDRYLKKFREEYGDVPDVRYQGFKTDAATRRGEYSEKFKNQS